jgi:hypothetical protein
MAHAPAQRPRFLPLHRGEKYVPPRGCTAKSASGCIPIQGKSAVPTLCIFMPFCFAFLERSA